MRTILILLAVAFTVTAINFEQTLQAPQYADPDKYGLFISLKLSNLKVFFKYITNHVPLSVTECALLGNCQMVPRFTVAVTHSQ